MNVRSKKCKKRNKKKEQDTCSNTDTFFTDLDDKIAFHENNLSYKMNGSSQSKLDISKLSCAIHFNRSSLCDMCCDKWVKVFWGCFVLGTDVYIGRHSGMDRRHQLTD